MHICIPRIFLWLSRAQEMKNVKGSTITDLPLYTWNSLRITTVKLPLPTRILKNGHKNVCIHSPLPHHFGGLCNSYTVRAYRHYKVHFSFNFHLVFLLHGNIYWVVTTSPHGSVSPGMLLDWSSFSVDNSGRAHGKNSVCKVIMGLYRRSVLLDINSWFILSLSILPILFHFLLP